MSERNPSFGFLAVLAAAVVLAGLFFLMLRSGIRPELDRGLAVGEPAPPIRAEGWLNGPPPTEDELRGRVVVVEAWASWCGPCRARAPELVEIYEKFRDQGVIFLGLTAEPEEALPEIEEFLEEAGISWVNGYGAIETLLQLEAEAIPSTWVIGPDGRIIWNEASRGTLEDGIEQALAQIESPEFPAGSED